MDRPGSLRFVGRGMAPVAARSLQSFRIVCLNGPRQAGKTTLAQALVKELGGTYETLDDETTLTRVLRDPRGFVERPGLLAIDEAQRGGDALLRAVKLVSDRDPEPGRFLLTGSTRFLGDPRLTEALTGRADLLDLRTLSRSEVLKRGETFVDRIFSGDEGVRSLRPDAASRADYLELACTGGFPPAVRLSEAPRARWFDAYARGLVSRDARDVVNIHDPAGLGRLLRLVAARTAQELNTANIARDLAMPGSTVASHLRLLETLYAIDVLPAWSRNLASKVVRHPKLHLSDSGFAARLARATPRSLAGLHAPFAGPLLETFVTGEILKQREWSDVRVELHHFRDRGGLEVDLILESDDGRIAGVEVKAGLSVVPPDLRGLERMRDVLGPEFSHGVVLHAGDAVHPMGDRITALPIAALWAV